MKDKLAVLQILLLLTGFFLLLEISFAIQCSQVYLADFSFVANQLNFPLTLLPGICVFIGAQLLIHLIYSMIVWGMSDQIAYLLSMQHLRVAIACWIFGIVTVLVANQYCFPHSKFVELTALVLCNQVVLYSALLISLFGCFLSELTKWHWAVFTFAWSVNQ